MSIQNVMRNELVDGGKRSIGVWDLICWAFRNECVSLDPYEEQTGIEARVSVDPLYQLMQIGQLGCRVQGGGCSPAHHDADIVASTIAVLPDERGGWRMACSIVEWARAGECPEWDIRPRVEPANTVANRWGVHAQLADAQDLGAHGWPHQVRVNRKGKSVRERVDYCPVEIRPSASVVARARRNYLDWYGALLHIRHALQLSHLTSFCVSDRMPPRTPWKKTA